MSFPHGAAVLQEKICFGVGSKGAAVAICSTMGCPWASADLYFVPGAPLSLPPSLILVFPVLFLTLSPHVPSFACVAGFALSKICFPRDDSNWAEQCLQWILWNHQEPAVSSTGQPWSPLPEAPAIPLLPTPRHGHPTEHQMIFKIFVTGKLQECNNAY